MTATTAAPTRPSTECRLGNHHTCKRLQMRCACDCHGGTQVPNAASTARSDRQREMAARPPLSPPRSETEAIARSRGEVSPVSGKEPVIGLIKKDPPAPATKGGRAQQIVALLAEIPEDDTDWYRVGAWPTQRGAGQMIRHLVNASPDGWEWKAVDGEVYVRRATQ